MDTQGIIEGYKQKAIDGEEKVLYLLKDDRRVVGEIVSQNNTLFYVIKVPSGEYTVEPAWNQQIIESFIEIRVVKKTVTLANT